MAIVNGWSPIRTVEIEKDRRAPFRLQVLRRRDDPADGGILAEVVLGPVRQEAWQFSVRGSDRGEPDPDCELGNAFTVHHRDDRPLAFRARSSTRHVQDGIRVPRVLAQLLDRFGSRQDEQSDVAAFGFLFHFLHDRQSPRPGADD